MARPKRRLGNLPAETTSFVGRRRELAELRKKLASARIVSLVGPGGVGKTRLAIRAATDLARGFSGGAWLVELADIRDPALVGNALMAALDLRDQTGTEPQALLFSYLRDKQLLLVVDNCEHLLTASGQLVNVITEAAPGVRVIATSREPLSISGEHVLPVPPLELPAAHAAEPLEQLRENEAVALFTERAAAASGTFELTSANQAAVADLCRRLDGVPLAIELAAVRTRVLSVDQILQRLTDRFGLLTGGDHAALPRHQTLRTTIEWSHELLTSNEQALLRRLCVFVGRFTLEDVEGICGANALDGLSSLVEKSLVTKEEFKGTACFRLHETMREYAALRLRDANEVAAVHERCTAYYVKTCAEAGGQAARYRLATWLEWTEMEIDNLRSVLSRCLSLRDFSRGLELTSSLGWHWITRATTEGTRWLEEFLAPEQGTPYALGWASFLRGFLAVLQADPSTATPWLERAATIARQLGDDLMLTQAQTMASIAANYAGNRAAAAELLEDAKAAVARIDDVSAATAVLQARVMNAMFEGDMDTVRSAAAEGVHLSRGADDLYVLEVMLMELALGVLVEGELDRAKLLYTEALKIAQRIDDRLAQSYLLVAFAWFADRAREPRLAAQLLGAAEAVRISAAANLIAPLGLLLAETQESAIAVLGQSKFEAEFNAGKLLKRETAVRLALGEREQPQTDGDAGGLLAKRERDVAQLVAEGLSNKQIGSRLFISERTVDSHVRSILNKLGFNSRAQIASWIAVSESQLTRRVTQ